MSVKKYENGRDDFEELNEAESVHRFKKLGRFTT